MGEVKGNYLSDRVRDNIEAAPWVRQEIIAIEASLDGALAECDELRAEVAMLRAACAAKDAALKAAVTLVRDRVPSGPDLHNACAALEAALSADAGKV